MPEDTLQKDNEAIISEMMRDAKVEGIPSDLIDHPVIHQGDETQPAPMVVSKVDSTGYVYVWDTKTFQKIPILYYMLAKKLRQRRDDGSFRFTTRDPRREPIRGHILCLLHPKSENRKHYDGLGFRTCPKDNITNPYQLDQHMLKKHPQEWAAIKAEKAEKERQEDRQLQQAILAQTAGVAGNTRRKKKALKQEV